MKKNFFRTMMGVLASMFIAARPRHSELQYQPDAPMPRGEVGIRSYGRKRIIPPHNQRSQERIKLRKEKHWMRLYELRQQGLYEYENKLYWMTHDLAVANR